FSHRFSDVLLAAAHIHRPEVSLKVPLCGKCETRYYLRMLLAGMYGAALTGLIGFGVVAVLNGAVLFPRAVGLGCLFGMGWFLVGPVSWLLPNPGGVSPLHSRTRHCRNSFSMVSVPGRRRSSTTFRQRMR